MIHYFLYFDKHISLFLKIFMNNFALLGYGHTTKVVLKLARGGK